MKKFSAAVICFFCIVCAADVHAACVFFTGNEYVCLSSDPPLTAPADGARRYDSDTRKHFLKVSGAWREITDHNNLANKGANTHSQIDAHLGAAAPHSGHEQTANKNAASGYAGLDSGGKIWSTQLPLPGAAALGGVRSVICSGTDKLSAIGTDGLPVCTADQTGAGGGYATVQDEGASLTQRTTLNFVGAGIACADDTTRTTCTIPGGGADLSAEPFLTSAASPNLSAERVLSAGTNTTIDTGTAGQIKVNLSGTHGDAFHADSYSGIGVCGANTWASTLNDTAAPTCTQPGFSNLSGTASIAQGGTTETASTEDAVLVGAGTTDWQPRALPSCSSGATSKLLYDTATNTFSCGTVLVEVEFKRRAPFSSTLTLFDPASPLLTIIDPIGAVVVDGVALVKQAVGQYYYIVQTQTTWVPGAYTAKATGVDGAYTAFEITPAAFILE